KEETRNERDAWRLGDAPSDPEADATQASVAPARKTGRVRTVDPPCGIVDIDRRERADAPIVASLRIHQTRVETWRANTLALRRISDGRAADLSRALDKSPGNEQTLAPMATAGSLEALRELNRLRVIDALRQRGTASRSDIARQTGLSRTTVTTLVSDLQARGLVVEQPLVQVVGRGRPPTLLRLDPSVGAVVG